jgi:predicted dehydrogenase
MMAIKALVVGLGSIGKRHLGNLRKLAPRADITVWRQHARPGDEGTGYPDADRVVFSLEDALASQPEIAIIANPAAFHIQTGLPLAREGVSLLVEKPFSNNLEGVEDLIEMCAARCKTLMIGYNLRFHASLRCLKKNVEDGKIGKVLSVLAEVGQYLPDWRPGTEYSKNVSAQNRLGGGAVLELSHELDYTRWLVGEVRAVSAQTGKVSDLDMDVEDIADINLRFASGALGSVHLDMLQRVPARTCKLIGTEGTLVWDGISNNVRLFSVSTKSWQDVFPAQPLDRNAMYMDEMQHFLTCVKTGIKPLVTGEDGLQVLKIALAARESAFSQGTVRLSL